MKELLLLRHAKPEKPDSALTDFERTLSSFGIHEASLAGSLIRTKKIQPDLVISSPAERARQTAEIVMKTAGINSDQRVDQRIYEASAEQLLNVVKQIDESANLAMLVGHNPRFEHLQTDLTGVARHMPTAAVALLSLDIEKWSDARERCAELKWMITPKDLEQG